MKAWRSRPESREPSDASEFVPRKEFDRAQRQIEQQQEKIERFQHEAERLKQEIERLRRELEAALRASKRQAAPHSRGDPRPKPRRRGRRRGRAYGRRACRPLPPRVDEEFHVPLPARCPHCRGGVELKRRESQYQEEIVRRTFVRRFDIAVGRCRQCGRRVQGRHRLQISEAVGVGNVQLGPEALTLAAVLNKQMGLSLGHTRQALVYGFGLQVSRSGLCRALARMANKAAPSYSGLLQAARQSLVNSVDETGWKVGGRLQWLHVAVSAEVTVYAIRPGRGYEQSAVILGAGYEGFLIHDGWAPYYKFVLAFHQSCVSHLLRRCREMAQIASPTAATFPLAVRELLQAGLRLRDRYQQGRAPQHGLSLAPPRPAGP